MLYASPTTNTAELRAQILCSAIYWGEENLPSDPNYTPNDDGSCDAPTDRITQEYLDCECPFGAVGVKGGGNEEGLEVALDALCRSVANPPAECFEDGSPLVATDTGSPPIRAQMPTRVLIVSDEGDNSRRLPEGEVDADAYLAVYSKLGLDLTISVIGPAYVGEDGSCLGLTVDWQVQRYQYVAEATHGKYLPLTDINNSCMPLDLGDALDDVVEAF